MSKIMLTIVVEDTDTNEIIKTTTDIINFETYYDAECAYNKIQQNSSISDDRITIRYFAVLL